MGSSIHQSLASIPCYIVYKSTIMTVTLRLFDKLWIDLYFPPTIFSSISTKRALSTAQSSGFRIIPET